MHTTAYVLSQACRLAIPRPNLPIANMNDFAVGYSPYFKQHGIVAAENPPFDVAGKIPRPQGPMVVDKHLTNLNGRSLCAR